MTQDYFAGDPRSNLERMLAGDYYIADDPGIDRRVQRAAVLAARYRDAFTDDHDAAQSILAELFGSVGADVLVRPPVFVDLGSNITVGDRVAVNFNLTALDVAPIVIGDDSLIGPGVQLLTPTHPIDPAPRRAKLEAAEPITIGRNVWIGGGAIVLPGVTIGDDTVVGAGSVVTRDLPAGAVAVGNPARVVREIDDPPGERP